MSIVNSPASPCSKLTLERSIHGDGTTVVAMVVSAVEEKPEVVLIVQLSEEKFGATSVGETVVSMVLSTVGTRSEAVVLVVIIFEGGGLYDEWR